MPLKDIDVLAYVKLAEECEPHLTQGDQLEYYRKLESEYINFSSALGKCVEIQTDEYILYAVRIIGILFIPLPISLHSLVLFHSDVDI